MTRKYNKGDEPVPGWRLEAFLGQGGYGEVWKAIAPGGTEVAFKLISLSGREGLKEFRALKLVKRVRHPNLVPLVAFWLKDAEGRIVDEAEAENFGLTESTMARRTMQPTPTAPERKPVELLIAMGLGEKDLFRRLEECKTEGQPGIPLPELLNYMEDAARAIDYLNRPQHETGEGTVAIQHCDIKPFNIMIVGGAAQVCDFGLARMLGDVRKTLTAGTVAYIAPECLATNQPSASTDQYSLAVTYVELRTGALPYPSESYGDIVASITSGKLDLSRLPGPERRVLKKATARDPARRYPSASALVVELQRAIADGGSGVGKLAAVVLSLLVLGGVATGVAMWRPWERVAVGPSEVKPGGDPVDKPGDGGPAEVGEPNKGKESGTGTENGGPNGGQGTSTKTDPEDTRTNQIDVTDPGTVKNPHGETPVDPGTGQGEPVTIEPTEEERLAAEKAARELAEAERAKQELQERAREIEEVERLFANMEFAKCDERITAMLDASTAPAGELWLLRGRCRLKLNRAIEAIEDLQKAAVELTDDSSVFGNLGTAYLRSEMQQDAIKAFSRAIEISPDARDYSGRGTAYHEMGQLEEAEADHIAALALKPDYADARLSLGYVHAEMMDHSAEAIDELTSALRQGATDELLGHSARAVAAGNVGLTTLKAEDERLVQALEAIEADPNDAVARAKVAWQLATSPEERVRDSQRALLYARRACELTDNKDPTSLDALAAAQAAAEDFAAAVTTAQLALKVAPEEAQAAIQARLKLYQEGKAYRRPTAGTP